MQKKRQIENDVINTKYYYGTLLNNLLKIMLEGFKIKRSINICGKKVTHYIHKGYLESGIYITKNWRIANNYGDCLLEVDLEKGTKILEIEGKPNLKVLESMKRNYGKEIICSKIPFNKIIPRNKQLKIEELAELLKYKFLKTYKIQDCWKWEDRKSLWNWMHLLRRYNYDGFGDPESDIGVVIFSPCKVKIKKIISILEEMEWEDRKNIESLEEIEFLFSRIKNKNHIELSKLFNTKNPHHKKLAEKILRPSHNELNEPIDRNDIFIDI